MPVSKNTTYPPGPRTQPDRSPAGRTRAMHACTTRSRARNTAASLRPCKAVVAILPGPLPRLGRVRRSILRQMWCYAINTSDRAVSDIRAAR